jgi:RimJ/RimL family protein N-acetyltransferase
VIETGRLTMRGLEPDDLPRMLDVHLSNPQYLEWTEGSAGEPGRYDLGMPQRDWTIAELTPGRHWMGSFDKVTSETVGVADFVEENPNDRTAWVGLIMIQARRQRRGLGGEALEGILGHVRDLGRDRARLAVFGRNRPRLGLAERLGVREYDRSSLQTPEGPDELVIMELPL